MASMDNAFKGPQTVSTASSSAELKAQVDAWRLAFPGGPKSAAPLPAGIAVTVRQRPIVPSEIEIMATAKPSDHEFECTSVVSTTQVAVHCEKSALGRAFDQQDESELLQTKMFSVHRCFAPSEDDDAIYATIGQPLVDGLFAGGSSTVIAYGQTGSGKTFTQQNLQERIAGALLAQLPADAELTLSAFENMGDKCFDLLNNRNETPVRVGEDGDIQVCGLSETPFASKAELDEAVAWGAAQRATKATHVNHQSSRSHAIWSFKLRAKGSGELLGRLRIVDLAGSERAKDIKEHDEEQLNEMRQINYSLGCLKECVRLQLARATSEGKVHIPYRNCKLTMLLKECFEESSAAAGAAVRTVFIAHLSPLHSNCGHTLNTLDYSAAMIEATRADQEKAKFEGPEKWSKKKTQQWVAELEGGQYEKYLPAFNYTGKALSCEYSGDIVKKVELLGGTETEAFFVLDSFKELCKQAKKQQAQEKARAKKAAAAGGGGAGKEDADAWRMKFIDYYKSNSPENVKMVNDKFMEKWEGRYEELFGKLVQKYGAPKGADQDALLGGGFAAKMARDKALVDAAKANRESKADGGAAGIYGAAGKELDALVTMDERKEKK